MDQPESRFVRSASGPQGAGSVPRETAKFLSTGSARATAHETPRLTTFSDLRESAISSIREEFGADGLSRSHSVGPIRSQTQIDGETPKSTTSSGSRSPNRRVRSVPPVSRRSSAGKTSQLQRPPVLRAHLWKKSPSTLLFKYQWRYVAVVGGKMYWWASAQAAEEDGFKGAKGFLDFSENQCETVVDDLDVGKFTVMPRTGRWKGSVSFSGAEEGRTFRFDVRDSEYDRSSWLEAIHAHIQFGSAQRRQSVARTSIKKLLHNGGSISGSTDTAELERALKEAKAACVEADLLDKANDALIREDVTRDLLRGMDSLKSRKQERLRNDRETRLRISQTDESFDSNQAMLASRETQIANAIKAATMHPDIASDGASEAERHDGNRNSQKLRPDQSLGEKEQPVRVSASVSDLIPVEDVSIRELLRSCTLEPSTLWRMLCKD